MDRIVVALALGLALVFGTGVIVGVIAMAVARGARRPSSADQRDVTLQDAGKVRRWTPHTWR
jgi:hypothetical protein